MGPQRTWVRSCLQDYPGRMLLFHCYQSWICVKKVLFAKKAVVLISPRAEDHRQVRNRTRSQAIQTPKPTFPIVKTSYF